MNLTQLTFIFSTLCLFSCEINYTREIELLPANSTLPKIGKLEATTFKNIFIVDENKCKDWDQYLTRFSIEYPEYIIIDTAEINEDNYYYINFKEIVNDTIVEELSICSLNAPKSKDLFFGKEMLKYRTNQFKDSIYNFQIIKSRIDSFRDQSNYQIVTEVDLKKEDEGYFGRYRFYEVVFYPEVTNKNPVKFNWSKNIAYQDDTIYFDNSSVIGQILETFNFIE